VVEVRCREPQPAHQLQDAWLGGQVLAEGGEVMAVALEREATESRRPALLLQITTFIEQHLDDPGLTPAGVATANHISVRHLHKLFESEQVTVGEWIRRRRLERCRRDLVDPTRQAEPVAAIAARWGYRDPAHFSRLFRARYGTPPARYRTIETGQR
jgi:AraC-like DNA-binding protein